MSAVATFVRVSAAIGLALGAWLSLGALAVTAGGAAADRVGVLPGAGVLSACVVAAVVVVLAVRTRTDRLLPFLFLFVLILPWVPMPVPTGWLAWVGPMVILVWAGVAIAVVGAFGLRVPGRVTEVLRSPRASVIVAACLAFFIYVAAAHRLHTTGLIPGGDEPHYLVITQSLLLDGDLRIENNHQRGDYRRYIDIPLKPDFLKRSTDGAIYSVHAPGLPALMAPAFAIAGYPGAVWFLALVAAAGTALAWYVSWKMTASATAAWFGWASVALSTSFLFHAFAIYPDIVASVVFLATVGALASTPTPVGWFALGSAVACLPWLHTRFAVIAAVLALLVAERALHRADRWRCVLAFAVVPLVSAIVWFGFFWVIYGTPDPAVAYGRSSPTSTKYIARGLVGLLFDHQFGLVANAPVYLVSFVGLGVMIAARRPLAEARRGHRRLALQILSVSVPYACVTAAFPMWWAGASAPARFLVPLLLPLAVPAAVAWASAERRATRAWAFLLLALSAGVTLTLLVAEGGWLAYNVRDGYARLWDWASPLVDISAGLPSLFRQTPGTALALAGIWIAAAAVAWLSVRAFDAPGARSRGALALATLVAAWVAAEVALSVAWAAGAGAATRTTASAAWLLRTYDARIHTWAVTYRSSTAGGPGLARVAPGDVFRRLSLEWDSRRPRQTGELLSLGPLPAGEYRVRFHLTRASDGDLVLTVGRHDTALERWSLAGVPPGTHERVVRLPVPVVELILRAASPADAAVSSASVQPVSLPDRVVVRTPRARQALRTGDRLAFLLNEGAFFETAGFWLRPARPASVAFASREPTAGYRVGIRNAPVANTVHVRVDAWRQTLQLTPGEERSVEIPSRPGAPITVVEFLAEKGFQPALVDPATDDRRWLGCWIELR